MSGEGITPHGYALALALLSESAAPLPVRVAWAAFLRRIEPDPEEVRRAALEAHLTGHLRAGRLTAKGRGDALEYLRGVPIPPPSIHGPQVGRGGEL